MLEDISGLDAVLASTHLLPGGEGFWFSPPEIPEDAKPELLDRWLAWIENLVANPDVNILAHPGAELHNCGLTGDMQPDQLRKVREWLNAFPLNQSGVIMCHHPFEHLAPRARSNLGWLWRERRLAMLVSAHTHRGYFAHHDLGGKHDDIELNIGSTSDWPMEWRTLKGYVHSGKKRIYVESERNTLVDVLINRGGFFTPGWEVPLGAPDDYRRYKQNVPRWQPRLQPWYAPFAK